MCRAAAAAPRPRGGCSTSVHSSRKAPARAVIRSLIFSKLPTRRLQHQRPQQAEGACMRSEPISENAFKYFCAVAAAVQMPSHHEEHNNPPESLLGRQPRLPVYLSSTLTKTASVTACTHHF